MVEFLFGFAVGSSSSKRSCERNVEGRGVLFPTMVILGLSLILGVLYEFFPYKKELKETSKTILGNSESVGVPFSSPLEILLPMALFVGILLVVSILGYIIYKIKE